MINDVSIRRGACPENESPDQNPDVSKTGNAFISSATLLDDNKLNLMRFLSRLFLPLLTLRFFLCASKRSVRNVFSPLVESQHKTKQSAPLKNRSFKTESCCHQKICCLAVTSFCLTHKAWGNFIQIVSGFRHNFTGHYCCVHLWHIGLNCDPHAYSYIPMTVHR